MLEFTGGQGEGKNSWVAATMDVLGVAPTSGQLRESNCSRWEPEEASFRPGPRVNRVMSSLTRCTAQCAPFDDLNGVAAENWKRVPTFLKHSTFAGDVCRFLLTTQRGPTRRNPP